MVDPNTILSRIADYYLTSPDFNGISACRLTEELELDHETVKPILAGLIQEGQITAVFGNRHPNPHIKALPDLPIEQQLELLGSVEGSDYCLYPTRQVLERSVDKDVYAGRPFTLMLALGEPQLTALAFDLAVLEFYRNDPRYIYWTDDISGWISIRDEPALSTETHERDKVFLQSFGFAYDQELNRAVAVFLRYLADLSPEHQQIWHARILGPEYKLHPDYYRAHILGEWPERISIFEAFVEELAVINTMAAAMERPSLFRETFSERPRGFGFLIRPTLREFNDFVHLLDKMMSENISHGFFLNEVLYEDEVKREDGRIEVRPKGTIRILEDWLGKKFHTDNPEPLEQAIATFKKVRQLRQRPAHSIDEDVFHRDLIHRQRELIIEAYAAVRTLRECFSLHPKARTVPVRTELLEGKIWAY